MQEAEDMFATLTVYEEAQLLEESDVLALIPSEVSMTKIEEDLGMFEVPCTNDSSSGLANQQAVLDSWLPDEHTEICGQCAYQNQGGHQFPCAIVPLHSAMVFHHFLHQHEQADA